MIRVLSFFILAAILGGCRQKETETAPNGKPTVYIIGDSTVKNGRGDGAGGLWGWGDPVVQFFDTAKIRLENHALGGTSSRTYRSKGLWDGVLQNIKPGDYVLMQFGHNDGGPVNDTVRARGTIRGTGDEVREIDNLITGQHEVVHSYGWYIRQYIIEAKEKGAIPVVVAPIPRNIWINGHVPRNDSTYGLWAREMADFEEATFINLNGMMASAMEKLGEEQVTGTYFYKKDHTHPGAKGAVLAASLVVEGLKESDGCLLKNYLLDHPVIHFPVKKNVFIIGDSTVAGGSGKVVGWGRELPAYFDTTRVNIFNKARGGRSSRSYQYEGLWNEVLSRLQKGDFLLIQFGHNDGSDTGRPKYRGSLPGTGIETQLITRTDSTREVVHTYGWYMKKYIRDAKKKGAVVIVLSQIPRNEWEENKVERVDDSYGKWAREVARAEGAFFLDLNNAVALGYEAMGPRIAGLFFPGDHTHTNEAGARFNALQVAELIYNLKGCNLSGYVQLKKQK